MSKTKIKRFVERHADYLKVQIKDNKISLMDCKQFVEQVMTAHVNLQKQIKSDNSEQLETNSDLVYPRIGKVYQHYKNEFNYEVTGFSRNKENGEILVTYRSVEFGTLWSCELEEFAGSVNTSDDANSVFIPRYKLVETNS